MKFPLTVAQLAAMLLVVPALIVLAVLFVIVVAVQGRPFLYSSERMRSPERSFLLYKIRTMHPPDPLAEESVLSGRQARRVTPLGAFLRRTRFDEIPQIFNVLKGDMGFIGPRPPLRKYVDAYPDLYSEILSDTLPGITGLATVTLHRREERLLSRCDDPAEADLIYRTKCIPIKARLDLIYRRRRGLGLNLLILTRTVSRLSLLPAGERTRDPVRVSAAAAQGRRGLQPGPAFRTDASGARGLATTLAS